MLYLYIVVLFCSWHVIKEDFMYYVDYHMHSSHSPDCSESPENQILAAISKGIDEICFTDHIELGFSDWNYREMDIDRYIHDIRAFQEKYKHFKI